MSRRDILLSALESAPGDLRRFTQSVDESDAHRRPSPDAWSLAEVLAHLIDVEERYLARLKQVINEDGPRVPSIHPDESRYDSAVPTDQLIDRFEERRGETLVFLKGLSAGDWQRKTVHETWGAVSFRTLVQRLVDHDTNHLQQVATLHKGLNLKRRI